MCIYIDRILEQTVIMSANNKKRLVFFFYFESNYTNKLTIIPTIA